MTILFTDHKSDFGLGMSVRHFKLKWPDLDETKTDRLLFPSPSTIDKWKKKAKLKVVAKCKGVIGKPYTAPTGMCL